MGLGSIAMLPIESAAWAARAASRWTARLPRLLITANRSTSSAATEPVPTAAAIGSDR